MCWKEEAMMMIGTKRKRGEKRGKERQRTLVSNGTAKGGWKGRKRKAKGEKEKSRITKRKRRKIKGKLPLLRNADLWNMIFQKKRNIPLVSNPIWKMEGRREKTSVLRMTPREYFGTDLFLFSLLSFRETHVSQSRPPMVFGWFFITEKNGNHQVQHKKRGTA